MATEKVSATLSGLQSYGVVRVKGEPGDTIGRYQATIAVTLEENEFNLQVTVHTRDGWDAAKVAAFDKLKKWAEELAKIAEHERAGPHPVKL